ncbi:MAG: hypothetical protein H0V17_15810 [Deltaproteobacteria bacterium]|nr:hypothetical protein [Deltaproteobacteria bacterium]
MRLLLVISMLLGACAGGSPVGPVRFKNAPPVWRVDDRKDVATAPEKRRFLRWFYHFDTYYIRTVRAMNLTRHRRALGVNSLDEVPDSTWFTNRIGIRTMSPDEIRRGPGPESPDLHLPWTIVKAKSGGTAIGFVVEDARGVKFLLKFDLPKFPETETASDAITARLLWAVGYNVPSDHVVYFRRSDLKISPDAKMSVYRKKQPMTEAYVDRKLAQVAHEADGRIRGIASVFIEGKPLGGMPRLGVREGDVNDRIPHELRRDQRGQAALAAWLSSSDVKEDNTHDTWQEDPANKAIHYVVHYLIDFGNALGTDPELSGHLYLGYQYEIDPKESLKGILSLGLVRRPWETRKTETIRGLGLYSNEAYDPGTWKPNTGAQLPVIWADRFGQFWGSKILIRFTREQLAAAIEAGRFTDPRAAPTLLEAMIARQRTTARYWFQRVSPVDEIVVDGARMCFVDLAMRHRLEAAPASFTVGSYDATGRATAAPVKTVSDADGKACVAVTPGNGEAHYTILRIDSSRGVPGTLVHIAEDAGGKQRVIGIHRL